MADPIKVFYFGCWDRAGHFFYTETGRTVYDDPTCPWKDFEVDGCLQPGCFKNRFNRWDRAGATQEEGEALIHHRGGWTALSFWDRSVDKRGGCNSTFFAEGTHDFEAMVQIAKQRFPKIWQRFQFEIRLVEPTTVKSDS